MNKNFRRFYKIIVKSFKRYSSNVVFRKIKYGYNVPEEDWIKKNKENIKKIL